MRREVPNHRLPDLDDRLGPGEDLFRISSEHCRLIKDRSDDRRIRRAPADVSCQSGLHVVFRGMKVLVEKTLCGDDPTSRAEAAIGGYTRVANSLQRVQIAGRAH